MTLASRLSHKSVLSSREIAVSKENIFFHMNMCDYVSLELLFSHDNSEMLCSTVTSMYVCQREMTF